MDFFDKIKGKLIVSCQALEDEPLHSSFIMGRMAKAALVGGAAGIRAQSVADISEIKKVTGLPVIGLIKKNYPDSEIYITPTKKEVEELLESPCEMIALDMTLRKRPNDEEMADLIELIHAKGRLALADISTLEEGINAEKLGVDAISTTLSGYTPYSPQLAGPDLELVKSLLQSVKVPVIAEGRINTPSDAKEAMDVGAYAVIVGSAITRPQLITAKFAQAIIR